MTLHILPRPSAQVIDLRTRRPVHPDSVNAMLGFRTQQAMHLARHAAKADAVLLAVAADLLKAEEMADADDPESRGIQRAIIRRAGETIVRFRKPELLASAQTGSARP